MSNDSPPNWTFFEWIRHSRKFTRPMVWWKFYPSAVKKWFWFNRQQKIDRQRWGT